MRTRRSLGADLTAARWDAGTARRVLAAWRRSGVSMNEFARAYGVQGQRLSWWSRRLEARSDEHAPAAAPLAFVPAELTSTSAAVVVRVPGGVVLEVADAAALPPAWVAALARELASDRHLLTAVMSLALGACALLTLGWAWAHGRSPSARPAAAVR